MSDWDEDHSADSLGEDGFLDTEASESGSHDSESPRPAKRRRIQSHTTQDRHRNPRNERSDGFDDDEDSDDCTRPSEYSDDLPSPTQQSIDSDEAPKSKSKYKSFVPKYNNAREDTFVTQLTQPYSSPERIRGPRWKKPDPKPPVAIPRPIEARPIEATEPKNERHANNPDDDYGEDDEELNAAIAASLESFEAQNVKTSAAPSKSPTQQPPASNKTQIDDTVDMSFELEGIPDDAFDSSPSPPPTASTRPAASFRSSQSQFGRPTGLRQTTLFDMTGRNLDTRPQSFEQDQYPPEKNEPPTQHKLDAEAVNTWVYPTNLGKIRDYQFNITQKGLFHNLLVALPTGLGKTFIAATIMLNWFRWTKSAQIIFVAPTKPLVAQQISACFGVAGIPRSQTTMLTGEASPGIRAEQWQVKRVFFMTPQTLVNDLKSGIADPKRIVLLVVDEAHRATGGYAYVEVVSFLRRFNKSFRVLALTATPGSTVESVQAVIDGLDISRVEIRTEHSLDIREYVHTRNIEVQTFQNSDEMILCMDLLSRTLQPLVDQIRTLNAYWGRDPMGLTAYGLTMARQQWMRSDAGRNANFGLKGKVNAIFTVLASLAHAIDLLKYHGITPFYRHLLHFQSNTTGQKGGKYANQIVQDESFKKLMNQVRPWTTHPEFIGHPKLEYLKQIVLNHFMDAGEGQEDNQSQSKTRIMIFAHFRDSAEEITRVLKRFEPMIRPHVFVGQSSAKGSDGMDQKTQLGVVQKFKSGTYNTIVATSIGEEGLDIGEVDLIVCYDSSASPIRMLQRMGRTGRKRTGNITLLLMQGKEEESYLKAKDNYEKMQQLIASGTRFNFHDDRSPRILPPGMRPVPDRREIEIPVENSQQDLPEPKRGGRAPKKPPKKFHMPDDVETGFTRASDIGGNAPKRATKGSTSKGQPSTPQTVDIPSLEEVLLTPEQQKELQTRFSSVGSTNPQSSPILRNDAFPQLQRVPRPTNTVKHGSATNRVIGALQRIDKVGADCERRYQQILTQDLNVLDESFTESQPSSKRPSNGRRRISASSRRQSSSNSKRLPSVDEHSDNDATPQPSTYQSPLVVSQEAGPVNVSEASGSNSIDNDFDLPDIDTLVKESTHSRDARKRRFILEDDSDE
ncbi:hypothetical protein PHISCL_09716 [Aspergillus sclerotialis]|uniref:ATP-dependent DNA helicase n=1 Tax=Aspergillus sclerotialis TaxID=2070753 RepID=A0A3A2Z4X4_9EURO|nr:hypothetical protein PHISCL_09716 [Aspergillus sclerotialis]